MSDAGPGGSIVEGQVEGLNPTPSDREELLKKAQNAQFQGKRNFLMKDTASACAALEDACRLLVEIYGPLAKEHAEAHFFYGKALLDQARLDLAVFDAPGGAADATKSGDDDDDDEEDDGEEDDEMNEEDEEKGVEEGESGEQEKIIDNKSTTVEPETVQEANVGKVDEVASTLTNEEDISVPSPSIVAGNSSEAVVPPIASSNNIDNAQPSTSKGVSAVTAEVADEDKTVEEELNNLELAWEVFEIAKIDYTKHIEELEGMLLRASDDELSAEDRVVQRKLLCDLKRRLAETHSLLGEVGTESEIYPQAIEDFKTALAMYSDLESPDSREIAQVHFHIGLAYGLEKNFKESVESLGNSVNIIRQRIQNLTKEISESTNDVDKTSLIKEVQELTELLPELQEKINDTLDQEREAKKIQEDEQMEQEIILRNSPVKNPNPPAANDISHLVKKRKKIELESVPAPNHTTTTSDAVTEPPSKKICTSLPVDSTTTSTNGHSTAANDVPAKIE